MFSTKSNDGTHGIQNLFNERSNQTSERRVNQDVVSSTSSVGISSLLAKSNSIHNETSVSVSASASVENSPRRISVPKRRVRTGNSPERRRQDKPVNNEDSFSLPPLSRIDSQFSIHTIPDSCEAAVNRSTIASNAQKTKLIEDLRENVYKEVASLISANEERPHFLIQLFQDLQLVSSDPLRRNVLQSVQELITSSLTNASRQQQNEVEPARPIEKYSIAEESSAEYELLTMQHDASATTSDGNMSDIVADAQSDMQRATLMWPMISKHQDAQEQFHEPPMASFLNMRHEDDAYMMPFGNGEEEMPRLQILVQNGDLAEADQSCAAEEDDEGAVGGLLNILERSSSSNTGQIHLVEEELNLETEDESEQGLDQVPTRLSNPPSIGCSPKSQ